MANVLLINADPVPRVLPPLGICYIAENLKRHGHHPLIFDWGFDKKLKLNNIDVVGISATTLTYFDACKIIQKIKKRKPKMTVIIGGPHASLLPKQVLQNSGADAVVVGEGENIMVKIADGKLKAKGIIYVPLIEDLDTLPFPTYSYLDLNRYFKFGGSDRSRWTLPQPAMAIMGIRGCPFHCSFCSEKKLFRGRVRYRSVENIIEEIDYLQKFYGVKGINFLEDTLTVNQQRAIKLCKYLGEMNIKWVCQSRVDMVNEPLLKLMKKSGCQYIFYGVESGSERILQEVIKKEVTISQIIKTFKITKKVGIGIVANYIFGIPGETEEDLKATLEMVKKLPADAVALNIFVPLPGAELTEGLNLDWSTYSAERDPFWSHSILHNKKFANLVTAYHRKAVRAFYFSPRYIISRLKMFSRPEELYYAFKSFSRMIKEIIISYKSN